MYVLLCFFFFFFFFLRCRLHRAGMRLLTGAGTPRELPARGSAYLFCVILPDAALLTIIAFANRHPSAVLAITFEADVQLNTGFLIGLLGGKAHDMASTRI